MRSIIQGARVMGGGAPRQLKPKSTGDACFSLRSLAEDTGKMPRSDHVARSTDLRSGLVCSACGLARLAAARGNLNNFHQTFKAGGGGDEDHPSFLIQAPHPQLNTSVPLKAHLVEAQPSSLGSSVLHFAVTTDGYGPGRKPITVASAPAARHELSFAT